MADYLTIPLASPIGWIINTEAGTLNAGGVFYRNTLWPKVNTFVCGDTQPGYCQAFDCEDVLTIQVQHNNDTNPDLVLEVEEDGVVIAWSLFTVVTGEVKEATIDFSAIDPCNRCLRVYIRSLVVDEEGANSWGCGDDGTFETGTPATWDITTGPNNTITKDNTIFCEGANSAAVTAGASPAAGDELILQCYEPGPPPVNKTYTLQADTYYSLTAKLNFPFGAPWTPGVINTIGFSISGFSDATIIREVRVNPNLDGYSTCLDIEMVFKTGTDVTGEITIEDTATPAATGIVNVDAIALRVPGTQNEAVSQWICAEDLQSGICDRNCFTKITYYNDDDSSGMVYTSGLQNFFWVKMIMTDERYEDPLFKNNRSSDGTTDIIKSQLARVVTAKFDIAPPYIHQIIAAAIKHDHFQISGYEWHPLNAAYQPEYEENVLSARSEIELIDEGFVIDNSYC